MKLSDIKGEACLDVVADLIPPITRMAQDEDVVKLFKPQKAAEGQTDVQAFAKRMQAGLPKMIKDHREDLVSILAAINRQTVEEYSETLTLPKLMTDVMEILTDEDIVSFLSSPNKETEPLTSASETIGEDETSEPSEDTQSPATAGLSVI